MRAELLAPKIPNRPRGPAQERLVSAPSPAQPVTGVQAPGLRPSRCVRAAESSPPAAHAQVQRVRCASPGSGQRPGSDELRVPSPALECLPPSPWDAHCPPGPTADTHHPCWAGGVSAYTKGTVIPVLVAGVAPEGGHSGQNQEVPEAAWLPAGSSVLASLVPSSRRPRSEPGSRGRLDARPPSP
ncbi:hypothetical protein P7K49_022850 [Saguinus oedipus]|uniref:Uncharacterized protein n=1 Tax=Saguinus oedipus TaxID=9490 RepID=A0ABQ9UJZ9_SAGOE|nr:hypothetical protein P7K49_022850 [Saguinus oedipus]